MLLAFQCTDSPSNADLGKVDTGIGDFNAKELELQKVTALCVFARDGSGQIAGGAVGRTWGTCCELQQLWVAEQMRGHGVGDQLMDQFESQALARSCSLVYLDTFSFQARPFYAKRGYAVVLETRGFTNGIVKYTMHKQLELAPAKA